MLTSRAFCANQAFSRVSRADFSAGTPARAAPPFSVRPRNDRCGARAAHLDLICTRAKQLGAAWLRHRECLRGQDFETNQKTLVEGRIVRNESRRSLLPKILTAALAVPGIAEAAREYNLQRPVTPVARQMYDLHSFIFWICVVIFVIVFSVMFYSIFRHRKSIGHRAAHFHESATVEIIWTVIPFLILLFMAFPATRTILLLKDTSTPDMTIKVTGFQWKWNYDYLQEGFGYYSNLSTPRAQIEGREPKGEH